ncbi:hypothetical protein H261_03368 [Paramagnetospirillum caucaseum]|uniref:Uncharacterized protein n=1 Tax=Paramagnetospirillum caucaseum TaxID=1244869 RepID=M2YEK5_9PROT|nr:hypothetical protein [Paramagnetospirillum caucaseum]EME71416.1 hypothetical protein H261_03368 [Paramagnetospirillum caucaseum]
MTTGPTTVTIQIESCQGCDALVTDPVYLATYARCREAGRRIITAWWDRRTPTPPWCPAKSNSEESNHA